MSYNPNNPNGQAASANSAPVVLASDHSNINVAMVSNSEVGIVTETAPASDTASSGLNGRLQRIAQRITSLIALLPTSLGQKTMANSLGVTIASDQSAVMVSGDIAHGSTNSGKPVQMGGLAKTANPTAVSDGQRVNAIFDKVGRQVVVNAIRDLIGIQTTTITASTSETTIVTQVASTFLDLLSLVITNSSATATLVTLKDATAGTTRGIYSIPAGSGIVISFPKPLPQAAVNTNWTITCGTSVSSIYVVAQYEKNI